MRLRRAVDHVRFLKLQFIDPLDIDAVAAK